jgi:hypothetical protein
MEMLLVANMQSKSEDRNLSKPSSVIPHWINPLCPHHRIHFVVAGRRGRSLSKLSTLSVAYSKDAALISMTNQP